MGRKLYVGNLSLSVTESVLLEAFSQCGKVESTIVITDHHTGRSRGFGFVEMRTDEEASSAITKLNGSTYGGKSISVKEANPTAPKEKREVTRRR